ncbi:hypothetical protein NGC23_19720 [Leclercia pneumoniae]|nr:hypothetical protein [Leclercia pneumoniae]MEB7502402.1 hypothetical protein [Leclercia pneumoniae]
MKEGYYWIDHNKLRQVAYYTDENTEDMISGESIRGVWHLTRGMDLCNNYEVVILSGPIPPP